MKSRIFNKHYFLFYVIILTQSLLFAESNSIGEITFIIGDSSDVKVFHNNDNAWYNAKLGQLVNNGDILKTAPESRCEVTLLDKSLLRIGEESEFVFTKAYIKEKQKNVKSELVKGKIWFNIKSLKNNNSDFQVKTPTAVCAVRGTVYRVDSDSLTTCLVYEGAVDVGPNSFWDNPNITPKTNSLQPVQIPGPYEVPPPFEVTLDEWVKIVQGFQITIRPDGKYAKSQIDKDVDSNLDWVNWNQQRDKSIK